jgi:hypothetical protein
MATLRVRYRNGETDEWEIHERMKALEVTETLWKGMNGFVSFTSISHPTSAAAEFGRVGLRMNEVSMWQVDGLLDFPTDVGVWAEGQTPS